MLLLALVALAACGGAGDAQQQQEAAAEVGAEGAEDVAPADSAGAEAAATTEESVDAAAEEQGTGEQAAAEGEAAPADAAAADVPTPQPGGLVLMGWSSSEAENERLQQLIDQFNADNPDTPVTLSQVPDYDTKLQVSLAGGSPPDVFYVDAFKFHDLQQAGALAPIGDQLENPEDFYPNLAAAFTADGTLYCPPKDFSTLALFYNTQMFADAGVEPPTADWTWDDLRAAAEQLTNAEQGTYGIVLSPDLARWAAFLYQAGGSMTDEGATTMTVNSPEAVEALNFYVNLVLDGFAQQPAELDAGWNGEAFGRGRAAMAIEGNWMVPFLQDQFPDVQYGIVPLPAGPGGEATLSYTVCYAVAANAQNPEGALRLVNFLTGPEGMKAWTDLGLAMPTRQSLREDWVAQFPELQPFLDSAEFAHPWQFTAGFQEVFDTFNAGLQQAFAGVMLPEQILEETEAVGNEVLSR
jgi:multiple sugar transport system substrate-binding protein